MKGGLIPTEKVFQGFHDFSRGTWQKEGLWVRGGKGD